MFVQFFIELQEVWFVHNRLYDNANMVQVTLSSFVGELFNITLFQISIYNFKLWSKDNSNENIIFKTSAILSYDVFLFYRYKKDDNSNLHDPYGRAYDLCLKVMI